MQPFDAQALHPCRRALCDAGHEVECAADADGDCGGEFMDMFADPDVLVGVPVGDKEDVGRSR